MDCYNFNLLDAKKQVNYIYDHCKLIDFEVVREQYQTFGLCLYYNGHIFIEVRFDGMRGDRVKEIKAYNNMKQLSHWYERVNIKSVVSHPI